MSDFSKTTIRRLARKGISLVGLQHIPGPCGGDTGYVLNDNGTCRVVTFHGVLNLAAR